MKRLLASGESRAEPNSSIAALKSLTNIRSMKSTGSVTGVCDTIFSSMHKFGHVLGSLRERSDKLERIIYALGERPQRCRQGRAVGIRARGRTLETQRSEGLIEFAVGR